MGQPPGNYLSSSVLGHCLYVWFVFSYVSSYLVLVIPLCTFSSFFLKQSYAFLPHLDVSLSYT
jgi:hypothetical protein